MIVISVKLNLGLLAGKKFLNNQVYSHCANKTYHFTYMNNHSDAYSLVCSLVLFFSVSFRQPCTHTSSSSPVIAICGNIKSLLISKG